MEEGDPGWATPPPSGLGLSRVTSHTCSLGPCPPLPAASSAPLTWRGILPTVSSLFFFLHFPKNKQQKK